MLNRLLGLVARITVGKQLVGALAYAHDKLDGHRSEISLGILALVHGLKVVGVLPAETAEAIEKALALLPGKLGEAAQAKLIDQSIQSLGNG